MTSCYCDVPVREKQPRRRGFTLACEDGRGFRGVGVSQNRCGTLAQNFKNALNTCLWGLTRLVLPESDGGDPGLLKERVSVAVTLLVPRDPGLPEGAIDGRDMAKG